VVGIVRRPDPRALLELRGGEWDMCRNGQYTERGSRDHGFMSERWRIEPEYAIKVDSTLGLLGVLLEPTTVVVKAWAQVIAVGTGRSGSRESRWLTVPARSGCSPRWSANSAGWTSTCSTGRVGCQAGPGAGPRRDLSLRQRPGSRVRAGHHRECTGVGFGDCGFGPEDWSGRDHLPDRSRSRRCRLPGRGRRRGRSCPEEQRAVGSVNANKRHWYRPERPWPAPTGSGWAA